MDQQPSPLTRLPYLDAEPSASVGRLPYRSARPVAPVLAEPSFRVGEAERAAACDALADHFAAGRLDPAELDDRLARAVAARSQADLQALFRDLRPRRTVPAAAPEPTVVRGESGAAVPLLVLVVILCMLLAGGMLLVLGAYNPALFVAALVGGTATAVAGGCLASVWRAALHRR